MAVKLDFIAVSPCEPFKAGEFRPNPATLIPGVSWSDFTFILSGVEPGDALVQFLNKNPDQILAGFHFPSLARS